ncbi:MAG: hypothetical protein PHC60_02835 [Heliobacteriaceae bacterium]|nr:hypothetical protein [Heliobacteriaceae bacterium]MDD4587317.1 hypothetical protein [Heliobacteriaceae bacterium]
MAWGGKKLSILLLYPIKEEAEPGKVYLRQLPRKKDWLVRLVPAHQWRQPETRVRLLLTTPKSLPKQSQIDESTKLTEAKFVGVWELSSDLWLEPRRIKVACSPGEGLCFLAIIDHRNEPVSIYAGYYAPALLKTQELNPMVGEALDDR